MLKKILAIVLGFVSFLFPNVPVATVEFNDVAKDSWYYNDVMLSLENGIVSGRTDNMFEPESKLEIGEAVVAVSKLHAKLNGRYLRYAEDKVWYKYAVSNNLVDVNQFNDYSLCMTRLDFARLCYNIACKEHELLNHIRSIPDIDKKCTDYQKIETLYNLGIMLGKDEYGNFKPYEDITRAEMCVILNRILFSEKRIKKSFGDKEYERYDFFKSKVINQVCCEDLIFVSCDTYKVCKEYLDKLQAQINKFKGVCSFYLVTLDGKFSIGYNIDRPMLAASTVKAPFSLYSVKQIEEGKGNFDEVMTYEYKHRCGGSGIIQNSSFGTKYSIWNIICSTIDVSDNVGYYMLQDRFGIEEYNSFLDSINCSKMKLVNGMRWGYAYPREEALIWNELYNYSKTSKYGADLFELFINAKFNFIKESYLTNFKVDYEIAHKSGFNEQSRHDAAIVLLDGTPYFITIMTTSMNDGSEKVYFKNTSIILKEIVEEYVNSKQ